MTGDLTTIKQVQFELSSRNWKKKRNVTNVSTSHNRITSVTQLIYILVYQTVEWKIISPNHYQIKSQWSAVYIQIICSIEKPVQDPVWSGSVEVKFLFLTVFKVQTLNGLHPFDSHSRFTEVQFQGPCTLSDWRIQQLFGRFSLPRWTVHYGSNSPVNLVSKTLVFTLM